MFTLVWNRPFPHVDLMALVSRRYLHMSQTEVASRNRLEEMHLFSCQRVDEFLVVLFEATSQKAVLVSLL